MGVLAFRLFGVPTEVHPGFWVLPLYLGLRADPTVASMLSVVGVVLVSVLVHEFGHAALARRFGESPRISLHMLGGTTSWRPTSEMSRGRRAIVSLAGPGAGFALGIAAWVFSMALSGENRGAEEAPASQTDRILAMTVWVNFVWGAVNLLPVLPFDGGQVLSAALGPTRQRLTATVSLLFGLAVALFMLAMGWIIGAALFLAGGVVNYMASRRSAEERPRPEALAAALERARASLEATEYRQASAIAAAVVDAAGESSLRDEALEVLAWAELLDGQPEAAMRAVESAADPRRLDPYLIGAVSVGAGRTERALDVLGAARERGDDRPEVAGLLVRALLESGRAEEAGRLALSVADSVPTSDLRQLARQAFDGAAHVASARVFRQLFDRTGEPGDAFDAARAFARGGRRDDALQALTDAVRAGLPHPEAARHDADLATLSGDARFEALVPGAGG